MSATCKRVAGAAIVALLLASAGGTAGAGDGVVDYGDRVPSMSELREAFRTDGGATRMIVIDPPRNEARPEQLAPAAAPTAPQAAPSGQAHAARPPAETETSGGSGPQGVSIRIQFALNSAEIQPAFRPHVARIAEMMREMTDRRFLIVGHADALGPAHANQVLSERRARSVMSALVFDYGIDPGRVSSRGQGERAPRYQDPFDPRNRRVEFLLQ